jgi:UDP-glucose 4-epimerase
VPTSPDPGRARIVVTGATGNVGTALLRRLADDDRWSVTGVARRVPEAVAPYLGAEWMPCDIGAPGARGRLGDVMSGASAVVHLAWAINPSSSDPPMERTNRIGTRNVLRAAADAGVTQVVCASSVAAYRAADRWAAVDEDWPRDGVPGSAYSQGKATLETSLDRFAEAHPDISLARIRPCAVVQHDAGGEFARWLLSPWLPTSVVGMRWLPLPLWRSLRAQLVHSDDVAEAIRLIVAGGHAGPFNLAGAGLLDAVRLATGIGGPLLPVPRSAVLAGAWATWRMGVQPVHPGWLRLADLAPLVDTRRARSVLGWQPRYDAAAALADLMPGFRAAAGTASPALAPHTRSSVRWFRPSHQRQTP